MARRDADGPEGLGEVIDLRSNTGSTVPPVAGAQWDELHERWEVWDDAAGSWMIVGADGRGRIPRPAAEAIPAFLGRELHHADEVEATAPHVIDVDRFAPPPQPVPGAQWNEVAGRWERWDEVLEEWVHARSDMSPA